VKDGAVFHQDGTTDGGFAGGVGVGGESASPGDVAVTCWIESVAAFGKDPTGAGMLFAQGKVIGGNVLLVAREAFLSGRKLVHEGEAEIVLFAGKVHLGKEAAELAGGLPADLFAETSFVACGFDRFEHAQEIEEDAGEEMPIFGATGEQGAQREFVAVGFVDINDGKITLTAGGDIEPETIFAFGGEDFVERVQEETTDLVLAVGGAGGAELTEFFDDLNVFEMDTGNFVIVAAAFDYGPIDDVVGGSAERIAQVGLLINFLLTSAGFAISEELSAGELCAAGAVDDLDQAELNGIGHGDTKIQIPGAGICIFGIFDFGSGRKERKD